MSTAPDFRDLLSKPMDDIERPKPIPAGTYNGVIAKYEFGKSREKQTPFVRFHLGIHSAGDDVDASALVGVDLAKKQLRRDFYITDDALFRLKDLLKSLGVKTDGRQLNECIPDSLNVPCLIEVKQRTSENGEEIYNDVGNLKGAA